MLYENLYTCSFDTLKKVCRILGAKSGKSKMDTIDIIVKTVSNVSKKHKKEICTKIGVDNFSDITYVKYELVKKIGQGKEGTVYEVKLLDNGMHFAMKLFDLKKSVSRLSEEAFLQMIASKKEISPEIHDVNLSCKYIVMDLLPTLLFDILKQQKNGIVTKKQQEDFIGIFNNLDEAGVFHGDPNLNNFMFDKNNKFKIIDFGMASLIDTDLIKKHKTKYPNRKFMTLGLIINFSNRNCPKESINILQKNLL